MTILAFLASWFLVGLIVGWGVGSAARLGSREER